MLKAYKYRIYPKTEQAKKIDQTINACRLVYNLALEIKSWAYRNGTNLSIYDIAHGIKDLRAEYQWIADVDCVSLHASLNNLGKAYDKFFKGGGFPRYKSKKTTNSYRCQGKGSMRRIDWDKSLLSIPKIYDIPISLSRKFDGKIKNITIRKTPTNKYYASVLVEENCQLPSSPRINDATTMGIDVGIKSFVVTSDGRSFEPNRKLRDSLKRLQCLQNRASRKKKGSNNRKKANKKVAIIHEKISNQRIDYIHKVTTQLIRDNQADTFVIEDLNVMGMGKNRSLGQAISDVSFGEFFRQLKYKAEWYGKNIITIDRFAPSSKRCSACGELNQELTLADREWTCTCGSIHDRDFNAAKNIKHFGLEKHSPEGIGIEPVESSAIAGAMKQEVVIQHVDNPNPLVPGRKKRI